MSEPTKKVDLTAYPAKVGYGGNRVRHDDGHRQGRTSKHVDELAQVIADWHDDGPVTGADLALADHIIRNYTRKQAGR